ncbi:MAG: hypothetical protein HUJ93_00900 [Bacteroidales bacterium]|nr:hypothetical protein [Bacteroidales bacterium]
MKKTALLFAAALLVMSSSALQAQEANKKLVVSGFVNLKYQMDFNDEEITGNTFRIHRARLSVSGDLNKIFSYKLQGDFCNNPALVDAFVKAKFNKAFALQVGQFKVPFTLESPIAPISLSGIDYSVAVSNLVGYSDVSGVGKLGRDIGIAAMGSFLDLGGYDLFNYNVAIVNGQGPNQLDFNKRKDLVGRLNIVPLRPLTLSGSYYYGKLGDAGDLLRSRYSLGVQYEDGPILARGEYIAGETEFFDNPLFSAGWYALAGYTFEWKNGDGTTHKLQPVVKIESFNSDTDNLKGTNYYRLGVNWMPYGNVQLKVFYSLIHNRQTTVDNNQILAQLSFKF